MINGIPRWARWLAMAAGTMGAFVLVWGILTVAGQGLEVSLSLAGLASAIVAVPLGSWASRDQSFGVLEPASRDDEPAAPAGTEKQVVVGEIPREPVAFQPRQDLIRELDEAAQWDRVAVVCALTGTRGAGKTQLAAAYARSRVKQGCPVVAWINAADGDQVLAGLDRLADALGLRDPEEDSAAAAATVRRWLETYRQPCLLVFDNANDPDTLAPYLPATGLTQVVITSTRQDFENLGPQVAVGTFTSSEAATFLHQRTGLDDTVGAVDLAHEVGHLPLALAQAAAVIRSQRLSYATYIDRLRRLPLEEYLFRPAGAPYPRGTTEAILLSLADAEGSDITGLCRPLLDLLAVLSPAGMPRRLLYTAAEHDYLPGAGSHDDAGTARVDAALARLADTSLLTLGPDGTTVSVHRLIRRLVRDRAHHHDHLPATVAGAAHLLETLLVPRGQEWKQWSAAEDLTQQITALWGTAMAYPALLRHSTAEPSELVESLLRLRNWEVAHLLRIMDLARALPLAADVRAACERHLGEHHPDTLHARHNLAVAHRDAGRLDEAIRLLQRTRADRERVLGADHPEALASRNNLAHAYRQVGRLDEAIELYESTVRDRQRVLGADHGAALSSRNSLAAAYRNARRFDDAIALGKQNLTDSERVLGTDHPDTFISRNSLARAYRQAGRLDEAIPLLEQTLADREVVQGGDHPGTLNSQDNLARAYRQAGRLDEAITLHERNIAARARVLDEDHPETLAARHNLARAYGKVGRSEEAIACYERTLADCERILGGDHPLTRRTRKSLATLK